MKYRIYSEEEKNALLENDKDLINNTIENAIRMATSYSYSNDINSEDETWNRAK